MNAEAPFNHPDQPVRHTYPLAVQDASISTGLSLVMKTLPYALVRFGILVAISIATIVWLVFTFGGYAWLASTRAPILAYPWLFGWVGLGGYAYWIVGRYFLYLLKAGHIAVLTELITNGEIANCQQGMFQNGKNVVKERFGQVNAMFALDLLIHGVVRAFNRTLNFVSSLIPIPGLSEFTSIVNGVVYASTTYIDETLFSYNLARGDDNVWRSAQDGLVYYAQNAKEVLKTGVWIVVLDKVLTVVAWILCLAPAFMIAWILPTSVTMGGLLPLLVAGLFASNFRAAFLKPLFLTMIMVKFHCSVRGQAIHPEWDARLTSVSDKFRELRDKAASFGKPDSVRPVEIAPVSA